MGNKMWNKLFQTRILKRIYLERMGEPLIYNLAAGFFLLFGSTSKKIEYDCMPRQPYAYCILAAADHAKSYGIPRVTMIEFGVAAGAGFMNMCWIAEKVTRETGVQIDIVGFDSGEGMPPPVDYRDHPEKYFTGDFPVLNRQALLDALPANAKIYFGPIDESVALAKSEIASPIAFISIDVDYYWSTKQCLEILKWEPDRYLPSVPVYLDDVQDVDDNEYCGELLAVKEFNLETSLRKITIMNFLSKLRIFKNAIWHEQIYYAHIFDHEYRSISFIKNRRKTKAILTNPHLQDSSWIDSRLRNDAQSDQYHKAQ